MARQRRAPATQSNASQARPSRRVLKEKTNTVRSSAPVYDNDGELDNLVKDAKSSRLRARHPVAKESQEDGQYLMTGGLGRMTSDTSVPSEAVSATSDVSNPKGHLAQSDITRMGRRPPRTKRKLVQSKADAEVLEGVRKRMQATAQEQRTNVTRPSASPGDVNTSSDILVRKSPEVELAPSSAKPASARLAAKRASIVQPPASVLKLHNTPAMETSMLALKNFKRRPRQPSMLLMVQQRTASARPTPAKTDTVEDSFSFDLGADYAMDDDVDDEFAPEAEGTPLNVRRINPSSSSVAKSSETAQNRIQKARMHGKAQKRKSDDMEMSVGSLSALRTKRQRVQISEPSEVQAGEPISAPTQISAVQSSSDRPATPAAFIDSEVLVINSDASSTPPTAPSSSDRPSYRSHQSADHVPSTEEEGQYDSVTSNQAIGGERENLADEALAEPISSSPAPADQSGMVEGDIFADPLTQVSHSQRRKTRPTRKGKPLTTAALQNLLPRRRRVVEPRRHRRSDYDFESASEQGAENSYDAGHLEDDEDELSGRIQPQTSNSTRGKKSLGTKSSAAVSKKSRQSKPTTRRKSTITKPVRQSNAASANDAKGSRKYGGRRGTTSDKENDDGSASEGGEAEESTLPEVSITMLEASCAQELADAKRKFADIDGWDMEFESMSFEDHRSSSQGWR